MKRHLSRKQQAILAYLLLYLAFKCQDGDDDDDDTEEDEGSSLDELEDGFYEDLEGSEEED